MRTVILRHTLPDGSWHCDWLVEREEHGPIPTWRTGHTQPDDPEVQAFEAERIGEHRPLYLDFEGEVSGGRGRVERLASGEIEDSQWGDGSLVLSVRFGDRVVRFVGRCIEGGSWRFLTMHG